MPFKYEPTPTEVFEERSTRPSLFDSILKPGFIERIMKERKEPYQIRLLPATWDVNIAKKAWGCQVYVHGRIGADNKQTYLCQLSLNHSKDCFLCEQHLEQKRLGNKDAAYALKAFPKSIAWAIFREEEIKGPQLVRFSCSDKGLSETAIWKISKDPLSKKSLYIDDPENGYDLFLGRSGSTQFNTSYTYQIAPRSTPLHADPKKMEEWLDFITAHPIPSILRFYDDAHIKDVYNGKVEAKQEEQVQTREEIAAPNVAPSVTTPPVEQKVEAVKEIQTEPNRPTFLRRK